MIVGTFDAALRGQGRAKKKGPKKTAKESMAGQALSQIQVRYAIDLPRVSDFSVRRAALRDLAIVALLKRPSAQLNPRLLGSTGSWYRLFHGFRLVSGWVQRSGTSWRGLKFPPNFYEMGGAGGFRYRRGFMRSTALRTDPIALRTFFAIISPLVIVRDPLRDGSRLPVLAAALTCGAGCAYGPVARSYIGLVDNRLDFHADRLPLALPGHSARSGESLGVADAL